MVADPSALCSIAQDSARRAMAEHPAQMMSPLGCEGGGVSDSSPASSSAPLQASPARAAPGLSAGAGKAAGPECSGGQQRRGNTHDERNKAGAQPSDVERGGRRAPLRSPAPEPKRHRSSAESGPRARDTAGSAGLEDARSFLLPSGSLNQVRPDPGTNS